MGLNKELVKLAFGWAQGAQGNTLQQSDGFKNTGTIQMRPNLSLNKGTQQSVVNPSAPKAPSGGINPAANPAAQATGQSASGAGTPGPLSGQQPKSASLNATLLKMARAQIIWDQQNS